MSFDRAPYYPQNCSITALKPKPLLIVQLAISSIKLERKISVAAIRIRAAKMNGRLADVDVCATQPPTR
jgi:hypothetical protein